MIGRSLLPLLLAPLVGAGCSIDREGLRPIEAAAVDAGGVECPPGTVDANGDPDDGCEYACTPTSPSEELCDGMDNDCDPSTEDGSDDPGIGIECDGGDDDMCPEGTTLCTGGRMVCEDPTGNSRETCNGEDDDCDGTVDEEADDAIDWFLDRDADGYGGEDELAVTRCQAPEGHSDVAGDCDDLDMGINPGAAEVCDTVDQDCNGIIDDAPSGCDCVGEVFDGTTYLFCRTSRTWTEARDDCGTKGGNLVVIDDSTENDWVTERADHYDSDAWWIGLNDRDGEGDYEWVDGTAVGYTNWNDGEPNNGAGSWGGNEDCVEINRFSAVGTWNDLDCPTPNLYICEL